VNVKMATRNPTNAKIDDGLCTDYVLHKSQQTIFNGIQGKIIDYTEHRLLRYLSTVKDPQQRLVLTAILHDYCLGHIAIAWKRGSPTYLRVTKQR